MPINEINPRGPGFFVDKNAKKAADELRAQRQDPALAKASRKKQLVNVGGQGDCGFRALAAAMVDNIITNNRLVHAKPNQELSRANQDFCSNLLQRHVALFPHYNEAVGEGLWTPVERLERMRHKQGFIPDLAFTLRQAAVDEIVAHPVEYRGAFVDYSESSQLGLIAVDQETTPARMRQVNTWIDESAIAAVANVFNLPVTVRVKNANQELFKPLHYGPDNASTLLKANEIEIQLEQQHYQPMLADSTAFAAVINQSAFMQQDFRQPLESHDPSLEEMLARIEVADKQLVEDFSDHKAHLTALVLEGRLDKQQLLAIYIQGLNKQENSGYLAGRINAVKAERRQVGIEHGNQDFFERAIQNAGSTMALTRSNPNDVLDTIIVEELVHAIARAMTINDLSPKDVYTPQVSGYR